MGSQDSDSNGSYWKHRYFSWYHLDCFWSKRNHSIWYYTVSDTFFEKKSLNEKWVKLNCMTKENYFK